MYWAPGAYLISFFKAKLGVRNRAKLASCFNVTTRDPFHVLQLEKLKLHFTQLLLLLHTGIFDQIFFHFSIIAPLSLSWMHTGTFAWNFFHFSIIIASLSLSWVSKGAKKLKKLKIFIRCYFSVEQYSKTCKKNWLFWCLFRVHLILAEKPIPNFWNELAWTFLLLLTPRAQWYSVLDLFFVAPPSNFFHYIKSKAKISIWLIWKKCWAKFPVCAALQRKILMIFAPALC